MDGMSIWQTLDRKSLRRPASGGLGPPGPAWSAAVPAGRARLRCTLAVPGPPIATLLLCVVGLDLSPAHIGVG